MGIVENSVLNLVVWGGIFLWVGREEFLGGEGKIKVGRGRKKSERLFCLIMKRSGREEVG